MLGSWSACRHSLGPRWGWSAPSPVNIGLAAGINRWIARWVLHKYPLWKPCCETCIIELSNMISLTRLNYFTTTDVKIIGQKAWIDVGSVPLSLGGLWRKNCLSVGPAHLIMLGWIQSWSALLLDDFEYFIAVHNSGNELGWYEATVFCADGIALIGYFWTCRWLNQSFSRILSSKCFLQNMLS